MHKVLVVDDNQLSELPESLGGLLQLERLSVQSNTLTRLPSTVGSLKRLLSLSVARNRLSVLPNALAECDSLEELDASQNRLQVTAGDGNAAADMCCRGESNAVAIVGDSGQLWQVEATQAADARAE